MKRFKALKQKRMCWYQLLTKSPCRYLDSSEKGIVDVEVMDE